MTDDQRARALRLADFLDELRYAGAFHDAAFLRELANEPCKRTEQDAFEDWLEKERPSGDVTEVQRQWESSIELAEFLDEQREQVEPERVPLTQELAVRTCEVINALRFVRTHLYAAQAQAQPGDDPIIMRHVYDAYRRIADLTKEVELHGIV